MGSPTFRAVTTAGRHAEEPTLDGGKSMKVESQGETLNVSEIKELGAANSQVFRDQVRGAFGELQRNIQIDLSETNFVDSCGLGALISLHKTTCNRNGTVRLLNPTPPVQQILELTRMHRIFEIVNN
jgi:anti-sigma B factor antagonist